MGGRKRTGPARGGPDGPLSASCSSGNAIGASPPWDGDGEGLFRLTNTNQRPNTTNAMTTLNITLLTIALHVSTTGFGSTTEPSRTGAPATSTPSAAVVRRDLVDAQFSPSRSADMLLMREARPASNGWVVKVKAADGTLRMEGTYADEQLTLPMGHFRFYHENGQLESEGTFVEGRKTGVWSRFDRAGRPLAERVYDGRSHEQLATAHGW